jgi:hypothetical protein
MIAANPSLRERPAYRLPTRTPSPDLVRRLDWRFLLPEPRLRRVLYVGAGDGPLTAALAQLSERLCMSGAGHPSGVDVLVAEGVGRDALARALPNLASGGALYWELPRYRSPFRSEIRWLHDRGLGDVRLHWHIPDFETCRQIVPLDDPAATQFLLRDHLGRVGYEIAGRVCRRLTVAGGFWRLLPAISVTALSGPSRTRP